MDLTADPRECLLSLIRQRGVLRGKFVLSSGGRSDYYIDARRVTLSGEGSRLIGEVIFRRLAPNYPDAVSGMSMGADPIVTAVTVISAGYGRPIDGLLVRKTPKEHGTGKLVEGPVRSGMRAVVVEDTSTTGASALQAAEALRASDVRVTKVLTLIDREEGAGEAVREAGYDFEAIFTADEVVSSEHQLESTSLPSAPQRAGAQGEGVDRQSKLIVYTDGASQGNPGRAGAGYVIFAPDGKELDRGARSLGTLTNNSAEYRALILGLQRAAEMGANEVIVRMDSELVVKQMQGIYRVKHPDLIPLHRYAHEVASKFAEVRFESVPRERNRIADRMATEAASSGTAV